MPSVSDGLIESRAKGLSQLFQRRDLLPRTLKFFTALGDLDAVRAALDENANDPATVNDAFVCAVRFQHEAVASILLERAIALDPALGNHVDESVGRIAFVKHFLDKRSLDFDHARAVGLWQTFVIGQVVLAEHESNLTAFMRVLRREAWLLGDDCVWLQATLIERAVLHDREAFIVALLDLQPALLRKQPPPSQAIGMALTYGKSHLVPLLTRIWPVPDDLPHAAGLGNLSRVKGWFDQAGAPALGDLDDQFPCNDPHARKYDDLHWGAPAVQHVLDTALAWSVINRRFDVADFLLEHGANINTNWNAHEPASILHHLVFLPDNYDSMRFLIDRGIDMTIEDYRWNSTAQGWARYGKNDEKMARWLADAEQKRELKP